MTIPSRRAKPQDLTDAEFAELDELLALTPEPLEPVDAVMLDGFLCGVLVQPELIPADQWLPHVYDFDARPLPEGTDPAWQSKVESMVLRRHAALNRAMEEDGWFDPLVLEMDEEAQAEASDAGDSGATAKDGDTDPLAGLSPISRSLMPWVAGFQHATLSFPALADMPEDGVQMALARLFRHLPIPEGEEGANEREILATLDREFPLHTLEDAMEELVVTVADLCDMTRDARYRVATVQRETPKLGRNDPCHCGSGKKFKACHGAS